ATWARSRRDRTSPFGNGSARDRSVRHAGRSKARRAQGDNGRTCPRERRVISGHGTKGDCMKAGRQRLTKPLGREDGALRVASWDEALDAAAAGLRAARDRGGSGGVGVFSCSKATNEVNFIAQKFIRQALGSNNIDSCNRT